MHILFKRFFNLNDNGQFPNDFSSGFQYLDGFGYVKKKKSCDSYMIRKCEDPIIIRLRNEAIESYKHFFKIFNDNFSSGYSHHKTFKPLNSVIDLIREEIEFKFINKNDISVLYTVFFEFNGADGAKETVNICYHIPINEREPSSCDVNCSLITVPCSYNYYKEFAVDFKYTGKYYPTHILTTVYIAKTFSNQIEEQFENIDKFIENFDDNIKILSMLVF